MLLTSNWREWYHSRHLTQCFLSGTSFEQYITSLLSRFHDDFVNPSPAGALGDGGCDGLAESGTILYACYGQRPSRNAEGELDAKLRADFSRGLAEWTTFHTWRFVTNAPFGPTATRSFATLQASHGPGSARPLTIRIWNAEKIWSEVVSTLSPSDLDELFPGAPGILHLELADLIPLLDSLGSGDVTEESTAEILPVDQRKMDYNNLSESSRQEFNAGRLVAPRIDRWYSEASDPALRDSHGVKFREIYREALSVVNTPAEILERLYVAVAGPNFRMDGRRANAAYAVVSYYFDACQIFESPPLNTGDASVTSD